MTGPRVAVVGSGVMGAMTAWRLAARGAQVTAYDRFGPAHDRGASTGESRIFRTAYKEGVAYVPLLRAAGRLWDELESPGRPRLRTVTGGLTIGRPDHEDVAAVRACASELDLDHEVLDADALRGRFPQHRVDDDEVGVLDPDAGVVRPELAVRTALEAARSAGAEVRSHRGVDRIEPRGGRWTLTGDDLTVSVDHVVLAPGPWAPGLPILAGLPLLVRQMTACWLMPRDPDSHRPDRMPIGFRRHPEGAFSCFSTLDSLAVKIVPHHLGWPEIRDVDAVPRYVDPAYARAVADAARALLPGVDPSPVRITGFPESFTPDGHGVVGAVPGLEGVTVLSGFSGHGFKLAPVFGDVAADLVLDGSTARDVAHLDPRRFGAPVGFP